MLIDDGSMGSWSLLQLREYLEDSLGLPLPADGAPIDEYRQWMVAAFFVSFCHEEGDPHRGKLRAANFLLEESGDILPQLHPHIESALGRALSTQELIEGHITAL